MKTIDQIFSRMISNNTLVCCWLDPDLSKIPFEIHEQNISDEEKVFKFLCTVIDITASHVCLYKAQKAFFDILPGGHEVIKSLIAYVHKNYPGLPVVVDCKINDIDNTMLIYIKNIFDSLNADGVVVNPYMGDDTMFPLAELSEKAIIVLVKTSNQKGSVIQDLILENDLPLWRYVLDLVINRWNYNGNMIPVLSSNCECNMAGIRAIIPENMPILLAGVGAQNGNYSSLNLLLNKNKNGVFVNSSRGILYSNTEKPWRLAIENAVIELKESLNKTGGRHE